MSIDLFSYSVEDLLKLENDDKLKFDKFDAETAWELGNFARKLAIEKYPTKPVVIDISLATGHILFKSTTKAGTALDNDKWVERKKNTVRRIGTSSFVVGQKLRIKKCGIEDGLFVSSIDYAAHGGCVPIKVKNVDHLIATLTLSGLPQDQDHLLVLEILEKFNAK